MPRSRSRSSRSRTRKAEYPPPRGPPAPEPPGYSDWGHYEGEASRPKEEARPRRPGAIIEQYATVDQYKELQDCQEDFSSLKAKIKRNSVLCEGEISVLEVLIGAFQEPYVRQRRFDFRKKHEQDGDRARFLRKVSHEQAKSWISEDTTNRTFIKQVFDEVSARDHKHRKKSRK